MTETGQLDRPSMGHAAAQRSFQPPFPLAVAPDPVGASVAPIPLRVRWREFRVRVLPVVMFLAALSLVVRLWPFSGDPEPALRASQSASKPASASSASDVHVSGGASSFGCATPSPLSAEAWAQDQSP